MSLNEELAIPRLAFGLLLLFDKPVYLGSIKENRFLWSYQVDKKVKEYIKEHGLLKNNDVLVIGASGGPDSMALLYILARLQSELGIKVIAAHVNHGLRIQGDEEEQYVQEVCRELEIPFHSAHRDIRTLAKERKMSLEEAGREERYSFFREVRLKAGADLIATAHHQDDSAETVLLHLIRGSGIKGLRGILPRQEMLIRPLLCVGKSEILGFLENEQIGYCQDQSNTDQRYLRNRIRHKLMPLLKEDFNPNIVGSLNQLAEIAQQENALMESLTREVFEKIAIVNNNLDSVSLTVEELFERPVALQRRLIHLSLALLSGEGGWEMSDLELIRALQHKNGSTRILHLKKGVFARRVYGQIILSRQQPGRVSYSFALDAPRGQVFIGERGQLFSWEVKQAPLNMEKGMLLVDYDQLIEEELFLRSRRPGDRIRLSGATGSKKIKEFFIDRKIPWEQRDLIPLLATRTEILAIWDLAVSERIMVSPQTRNILVIKAEPAGK